MTESIQKHLVIPNDFHGQRIDSVLAELLPEYSRSQISHWIKTQGIKVNLKACKPKDKAVGGANITLEVNLTPLNADFRQCAAENIPLSVVFEDEDVLVINKPAGLVVHPGAGNREHTLVNALLHHAPSLSHLPRAGIVHRLDKDTTGLLIIAKTLEAHTSLIRQMQARTIHRRYFALVQGHVSTGGTIDTGFGRHPRNRLKMAVIGQGRQAITHYKVKKSYQEFTLLDVKLMTGRTHQIRVHLTHINHPIVGDQVYGARLRCPNTANEELALLLKQFKRQALHAYSIGFNHPRTETELAFETNLPDDFQHLLKALDTHYDI